MENLEHFINENKKYNFKVIGKDGKEYGAIKHNNNKYFAYDIITGEQISDGVKSSKRDFQDMIDYYIDKSISDKKSLSKTKKLLSSSIDSQIDIIVKDNKFLSDLKDKTLRRSIIKSAISDFISSITTDKKKWLSSNNIKSEDDLITFIDKKII